MKQDRLKKFETNSRKIISDFFIKNLKELEQEFWIININDVKIASDLSYLDIYVSSFLNSDTLCKTLAWYAQEITKEINKKIKFFKTPKIRFRYDNSGKKGSQIIQTINKLKI